MTALVNTLGGTLGFGENYVARNDDSYKAGISLDEVFGSQGLNFFGKTYHYISVNNNGNVTFTNSAGSSGLSTYTPFGLSNGGYPIIAAYFGDVDTRAPSAGTSAIAANQVTPTPGGTSMGSNLTWYDLDNTGYGTLTVTWDDVGYYNIGTNKLNAFQLQLIGTGNGGFDIAFRYEAINWTTGGASGGSNGLGGTVARAGYSTGDGISWYELSQSGNQTDMLALDETVGNTGQIGEYRFHVEGGTAGNDNIQGSSGADTMFGGEGNDTLAGGDGADYLSGGTGNDRLEGGSGDDTYVVDAGDTVIEGQDGGTDVVVADFSYTLGNFLEWLRLAGTANISGTGNALDNHLFGNTGNNVMDGGAGFDIADYSRATGGISVDLTNSASQSVGGGQGSDTLVSIEGLIGSIYNDLLTGGDAAEYFEGGSGNDVITAGAGNDLINGGNGGGNDTYAGGDGVDTLSFNGAASAIIANLLTGQASGIEVGTDTFSSIENLIGGRGADTLTGDAGNNIIDGQAGDDIINGGDGDDDIAGSAGNDTLVGGNGSDTVRYTLSTNAVTVNLGAGSATGTDVGTDTLSGFENVVGGQGGDYLEGDAAANRLDGYQGNDTLTGRGGDDAINGGDGVDTVVYSGNVANYGFAVASNALRVTDLVGSEGSDELVNVEQFSFADAQVQLLRPTKVGGTTYAGGASNDLVVGGDVTNDKINAGSGDNVILAGGGNNNVAAAEGRDIVYTGQGNDKISLGEGNNLVDAGDGKNSVTTLSGNDQITTGAGKDKIMAGEGANTIVAGGDADSITTGAGNDVIYAGSGNDKVTAGAGNDLIVGGQGADKLTGGLGSDTFVLDNIADGGFDSIADFADEDVIQLSLATFSSLNGAGASTFTTNLTATGADLHLLYNSAKGALYYDADGLGVGNTAVQIAAIKGTDAKTFAFDDLSLV